jgi:hypothetical protein
VLWGKVGAIPMKNSVFKISQYFILSLEPQKIGHSSHKQNPHDTIAMGVSLKRGGFEIFPLSCFVNVI